LLKIKQVLTNLNKKLIDNIKFEGMSFRGQDEVSKGITGFYRKLNEFKEVDFDDGDFLIIVQSYHMKQETKWTLSCQKWICLGYLAHAQTQQPDQMEYPIVL
jgi:hypothetical protein